MSDDARRLYRAAAEGLQPPPDLSGSQWPAAHRYFGPDYPSPERGKWNPDRVPLLNDVQDDLADPDLREVVLCAAAQSGKTEALLNWLFRQICVDPSSILFLTSTKDTRDDFVRQRVDVAIRDCPDVLDRIGRSAPTSGRPGRPASADLINQKMFRGGFVSFRMATSSHGLISTPFRDVCMDECDFYPPDVDGKGSPIDLAEKRQAAQSRPKTIKACTPTTETGAIWVAYQLSDQRLYHVPCPHCHAYQPLEWPQVRWEPGRESEAVYVCANCDEPIAHRYKPQMLARGRWVAKYPERRVRGYRWSALYAPLGLGATWGLLAEEFTRASKLAKAGDVRALMNFVQMRLAEPWKNQTARTVEAHPLWLRRERLIELPARAVLATVGVDMQGDRCELEVVAWAPGLESWSADFRVIWGDPSGPMFWQDLDVALGRSWPRADGRPPLRAAAACIDSGGNWTQAVYDYVLARTGRPLTAGPRLWAVKGDRDMDVNQKPVWPVRPAPAKSGRCPLYHVGTHSAKDVIFAQLEVTEAGPGCCHWPDHLGMHPVWGRERDLDHFEQLTAEHKLSIYQAGVRKQRWVKKHEHKPNEALDCRVYAYAALRGLMSLGYSLDRIAERDIRKAAAHTGPQRPPPPPRPYAGWSKRGRADW